MNRLFSFLLILATAPGMCAAADSAAPVAPAAPAVKAEPREVTDLLEKFVSWLHHFYPSSLMTTATASPLVLMVSSPQST